MNSKKAAVRYFRQWPHHEPQREEAKGCERENHRHVCLQKYVVARPVILHNLDYEHTNGILHTDVNNAKCSAQRCRRQWASN